MHVPRGSTGRFELFPEPEPTRSAAGTSHRRAASTFVLSRSDSERGTDGDLAESAVSGSGLRAARLTALQAPFEPVTIDPHGILETEDLPVGSCVHRLVVHPGGRRRRAARGVRPPAAEQGHALALTPDAKAWQLLTELPADLDPQVRELAVRVAGGDMTDGEKIAAVQRYFLANYQYQIGIDIPAGADPLTYFLLQKPAAHCEYFASGAAVLVARRGVPSRYVTGFVAVELNRHGGYWMARNRDAHAWVEAYDRDRGWVLVEATPAGGCSPTGFVRDGSTVGRLARPLATRGGCDPARRSARDSGRRGAMAPITRTLDRVAAAGLGLGNPADCSTGCAWHLRFPSIRGWSNCAACCAAWTSAGAGPGLSERPARRLINSPIGCFPSRPSADHQQAAEWYRQYATVRYSGPVDPQAIDQLRDQVAG
jgi:protein-glutamine gamma-glutamyltransferase